MVPRLHARGTSFKGASAYLFHDKGHAKTSERVAWVEMLNLWTAHADEAWFEMMQTWEDRAALKKAAGIKATGRDNKQPVLHLSLSWHADDKPTNAQMREAARGALDALGLKEHQAIIVAHQDEPHPHVHLLVNTVHPHTGKTATLNYSKEQLSRWAEAFQLEHGQPHCPERTKNNARRDKIRKDRAAEKAAAATPAEPRPRPKKPYEPVKDTSPNRRVWLEKSDIIARMKVLHRDLSAEHKNDNSALAREHFGRKSQASRAAMQRVAMVTAQQKEHYKPRWRGLYRNQKDELRQLKGASLFDRAVFVFRNRDRLALPGRSLTKKNIVGLILMPSRLAKTVEKAHERERKALSWRQSSETKVMTGRVWSTHKAEMHALHDREMTERNAMQSHHQAARAEITFQAAKEDLKANPPIITNEPAAQFNDAARPDPRPVKESRSARIMREMQERQAKGRDRDDFERDR